MMNTRDLLKRLTAVPCVGGEEIIMMETLSEILAPYGNVSGDAVNNISCTFGDGFHILLDAHIDEVGLIVTSITDDGFLKVGACGGIDCRMLPGAEVTVLGKRKTDGIICTLPPHLIKSENENKAPRVSEISVDIGMDRKEAEKIITPGNKITFKRHFTELLGGRISANCLDNRAGVAAVILALEKLKKLPVKVTALFSTQEELGIRGAKSGPFGLNVDEAVAVDVSFGYTPDCRREECGELSKGPMIGISPILSRQISDTLISSAKNNNIPYQLEIMSGRTGTDADVISVSEKGIKCGLVSIPLKYMHSPVEVIDMKDVENTAMLIAAYVEERSGACFA